MKQVSWLCMLLFWIPIPAFAHPGHGEEGLVAGLFHPLLGLDHILAAVAVGIWAASGSRRNIWRLPASFLSGVAIGGAIGFSGLSLPFYDFGILLSVVLLGMALLVPLDFPPALKAGLVFAFGLLHGNAHGSEATLTAGVIPFAVGFLISTVFLHGAGIAVVRGAQDFGEKNVVRLAGAACLAGAGWIATGMFPG